MNKLELDLDDLEVESFKTGPSSDEEEDTVEGQTGWSFDSEAASVYCCGHGTGTYTETQEQTSDASCCLCSGGNTCQNNTACNCSDYCDITETQACYDSEYESTCCF
jgi:hypothetical protein